jgi:anti-sigma B factor antagonist
MTEARTERTSSGTVVFYPRGRLDMVSGQALRAQLRTEVQSGNARLVVDLSGVDLIDSGGLSALISGLKAARQVGGSLYIANPSKQVRAILKLTNLHRVLELVDAGDDPSADEN